MLETSTCCTVSNRICTALLEFLNPCSYSAAIILADKCRNVGWVVDALCCLLSIRRRRGGGLKGKFQLSESTTCEVHVLEQFWEVALEVQLHAVHQQQLWPPEPDQLILSLQIRCLCKAWKEYSSSLLFSLSTLLCYSVLDVGYIFSSINAVDR